MGVVTSSPSFARDEHAITNVNGATQLPRTEFAGSRAVYVICTDDVERKPYFTDEKDAKNYLKIG